MAMRKPDGTVRGINKIWALMVAEHLDIRDPLTWLREGTRRFEENLLQMINDPNNLDEKGKFSIQKAKENIFIGSSDKELDFMIKTVDNVGKQAIYKKPTGSVATASVVSSRKPDGTVRGINKIWALILAEHLNINDPVSWLREGKKRFQENLKMLIHDPRNLDENGKFSISKAKQNVFINCSEQERVMLAQTADGIMGQARYHQQEIAKKKSINVDSATIAK